MSQALLIKREPVTLIRDRVYYSQIETLTLIAKYQKIPRAQLFRDILDEFLEVYLIRANMYICSQCKTVQKKVEGKCVKCGSKWRSETFSCQNCGTTRKNKERHEVPVGQEVFVFGDCCYFSGQYKELIKRMI